MKKQLLSIIQNKLTLAVGASVLVIGGINIVSANQTQQPQSIIPTAPITEAHVKKIVETYAGVTDLNYEQIILKTENNRHYYEVDAYKNNTEYDFDVDAITGDIISSDIKQLQTSSNTHHTNLLNEEQAKDIFVARVGKNQFHYYSIKLSQDDDNSTKIYEIDAIIDNVSYEADIHATTGDILKYEVEQKFITQIQHHPSTQQTDQQTTLSQSQIKQIVSTKTGESGLTYTKIQLTKDDDYGKSPIYEVEAHIGHLKYELDIDAVTGDVLHFEKDSED